MIRLPELPRLPAFTIPAPLARLVSHLPQRPPARALVLALNLALGRVLDRDALDALDGRRLRIRVRDAGVTMDLMLDGARFRTIPAGSAPDLTLEATTRDFIALALREEDADTLFFDRRLTMEGDTELGLLVKNTLDAVDWPGLARRLLPALPGRSQPA